MQALMKRLRLWPPAVLAALMLAVAAYAYFSLNAIPSQFQYLWIAPEPVAGSADENGVPGEASNIGLREARLGMDALTEQLAGACDPVILYAVADTVSVVAEQENAQAVATRWEAIDDGAYALKPLLLKTGRLIYPEEFQTGERVAMLNEKLAVALFNYAEPIDRVMLLGDKRYRIVGIVNDSRQVGDQTEYQLYTPYRCAEASSLPMNALCVQTRPVPGAGGWSAFESATAAMGKQGTRISLTKEKMNAALPLRVLLCAFGMLLILFGLRVLNRRSVALYRAYRLRLREQYAARLMPWLTARGLPLALGYAVCAFAFAQLFMAFVQPVYTFPEWIPKVLVEPNDIATAFWDVWQKQATLLELRSPELVRVRFFQVVMGWACGGLALTGGLIAARIGAGLRKYTQKAEGEGEGK